MTSELGLAADQSESQDLSAPLAITRLKKRPEFLRVADARRRWAMPGLVLQVAHQIPHQTNPSTGSGAGAGRKDATICPATPIRYGITATKKIGGSVVRNRAKRRLRALAEAILPTAARPGYDFVLIARFDTPTRPYELLISDLKTCLSRLKVTRPKTPDSTSDSGASRGGGTLA